MSQKSRNPLATAPILRKGGVHQKTNSAQRNKAKRQLKKELVAAGYRPQRSHLLSTVHEFR
jgi:hypothetical protein